MFFSKPVYNYGIIDVRFTVNATYKQNELWFGALYQWFSNLSYKHPCPAHFVCVPYQAHLIQLISSLVETARPELGVSTRDTYKMCREGVLVGQVWKPLLYTMYFPV